MVSQLKSITFFVLLIMTAMAYVQSAPSNGGSGSFGGSSASGWASVGGGNGGNNNGMRLQGWITPVDP
ncbi:unnamed protein product [Anisakis simplex]|uniref:Glycine-rich protein 5-like n=1 Tax=Anisakis simplex TaxID=6269 RepID=A0A0M3IZT1_ANISI|nr:unnamed protein product [Anisakis simplex]